MDPQSLAGVKKVIGGLPLPDFVHDIEYELDEDHLGNPCVRIRVIVADDVAPSFSSSRDEIIKEFAPYLQFNNVIVEAVLNSGLDMWPYVSVVGEAERATLTNLA